VTPEGGEEHGGGRQAGTSFIELSPKPDNPLRVGFFYKPQPLAEEGMAFFAPQPETRRLDLQAFQFLRHRTPLFDAKSEPIRRRAIVEISVAR
jgi:hypothetical protein